MAAADALEQQLRQRLPIALARYGYVFAWPDPWPGEHGPSVMTKFSSTAGLHTLIYADGALDKDITLNDPFDAVILRRGIEGKITVHLPALPPDAGRDRRCVYIAPFLQQTPTADFHPTLYVAIDPASSAPESKTTRIVDRAGGGTLTLTGDGMPSVFAQVMADIAAEQAASDRHLRSCLAGSGMHCTTHPTLTGEVILRDIGSTTGKWLTISHPATDLLLEQWPACDIAITFNDAFPLADTTASIGRLRLGPDIAPAALMRTSRSDTAGQLTVEIRSVNSPHLIRLSGPDAIVRAQTREIDIRIAPQAGFSMTVDADTRARHIVIDGERGPDYVLLSNAGDQLTLRRFSHYLCIDAESPAAQVGLDAWITACGPARLSLLQRQVSANIREIDIFRTDTLLILTLRGFNAWCDAMLLKARRQLVDATLDSDDHVALADPRRPLDLNVLVHRRPPATKLLVELPENPAPHCISTDATPVQLLIGQEWDAYTGLPAFVLLPLVNERRFTRLEDVTGDPAHIALDYVMQRPRKVCRIVLHVNGEQDCLAAYHASLQRQLAQSAARLRTFDDDAGTPDDAVVQSRPALAGDHPHGRDIGLPDASRHFRRLVKLNNVDDALFLPPASHGALDVELPTTTGDPARTMIDISRVRSGGNGHQPALVRRVQNDIIQFVNVETAFVMSVFGDPARVTATTKRIDEQILETARVDLHAFCTDGRPLLTLHPALDDVIAVRRFTGRKTLRIGSDKVRLALTGVLDGASHVTLLLQRDAVAFDVRIDPHVVDGYRRRDGVLEVGYGDDDGSLSVRAGEDVLAALEKALATAGAKAGAPTTVVVDIPAHDAHGTQDMRYEQVSADAVPPGFEKFSFDDDGGYVMVLRDVDFFASGPIHRAPDHRRDRRSADSRPGIADHIAMAGGTLVLLGSGLEMTTLCDGMRFVPPALVAVGSFATTLTTGNRLIVDIGENKLENMLVELPVTIGSGSIFSAYLLRALATAGVLFSPHTRTVLAMEMGGVLVLCIGGAIQLVEDLAKLADGSSGRKVLAGVGDTMVVAGTVLGGKQAFTELRSFLSTRFDVGSAAGLASETNELLASIRALQPPEILTPSDEEALFTASPLMRRRTSSTGAIRDRGTPIVSARRRSISTSVADDEEAATGAFWRAISSDAIEEEQDELLELPYTAITMPAAASGSALSTPSALSTVSRLRNLLCLTEPQRFAQARLATAGSALAIGGAGISLYLPTWLGWDNDKPTSGAKVGK